MLTAVTGVNWGDEGKGRMVDLLSEDYDIVVRYQGGNNAGHTVMNEQGKFILNLLPSGILRADVINVMGNGMVIDLEHLHGEIGRLIEAGITVGPDRLKISDRAVICMPYHKMQDILEEERLGDAKFGSTRRGIAPVYGDKYMKKAIRMGDLLEMDALKDRLEKIVEWKNLRIENVYGSHVTFDAIWRWVCKYQKILKPYICDTGAFLEQAATEGKNVMFEAQLGALRDIDFGIYPFTSSSSTIAAYAMIGAGIPQLKLTNTIGIMKAYSSCVGEGPFICEMSGEKAEILRKAGGEYGAATGRPRRVGPFDIPASRYGIRAQGADVLALTKLDVLSYMERIPVCTVYEVDGIKTDSFPIGEKLNRARPVTIELPGWGVDIGECRRAKELPAKALSYVRYLEEAVACKIRYLSVGPERSQIIVL